LKAPILIEDLHLELFSGDSIGIRIEDVPSIYLIGLVIGILVVLAMLVS
jgi:hypothetical protein